MAKFRLSGQLRTFPAIPTKFRWRPLLALVPLLVSFEAFQSENGYESAGIEYPIWRPLHLTGDFGDVPLSGVDKVALVF